MKNTFLALIVLAALIMPSLAELTDYQKGFVAGLRSGGILAQTYQQSIDGKATAQQYNTAANQYNSVIQSVFASNQTAINSFIAKLMPTGGVSTGYVGYPAAVSSNRPVHSIDASWNQSTTQHYNPDLKGTIYGYDPDTYYTMVGYSGSGLPTVYDKNGNYIGQRDQNGNPIDSSLQPP